MTLPKNKTIPNARPQPVGCCHHDWIDPRTTTTHHSLDELIDIVVHQHHADHRRCLAKIAAAFAQLRQRSSAPLGQDLEVAEVNFRVFRHNLEQHMETEEKLLFPLIRSGNNFTPSGLIAGNRRDHESLLTLLGKLSTSVRKLVDTSIEPHALAVELLGLVQSLTGELSRHFAQETELVFARCLTGEAVR